MIIKFRIFFICFFMLLFNCKEDVKITFDDINVSTQNNNLVEVNIPKASGNKEITIAINYEIEKSVSNTMRIDNPNNIKNQTIEEAITYFNKEYEIFKTDFPESSQIWEAQIDGEVLFQSHEIITISITSYVNTGGAHGILKIVFLNFDSNTGKRISNERLFTNIDAFKKIAQKHFNKTIKEKDMGFEYNKFQLPQNIGYTDDGLVLLYNTYEIAPYSTGIIEFNIPFNEIESYLVFNSTR